MGNVLWMGCFEWLNNSLVVYMTLRLWFLVFSLIWFLSSFAKWTVSARAQSNENSQRDVPAVEDVALTMPATMNGNVLIAGNSPVTERSTPPTDNSPKRTRIASDAPLVVKTSQSSCSCVLWAHAKLGVSFSVGLAKNHPMNTKTPSVGDIVVTHESSAGWNTGHLAVVTAVQEKGIVVSEGNYVRCKETHGRFISFSSGLIRGYWRKT